MEKLINYLLDHVIVDFSGDLTVDMVRDFLREDESQAARALLGKLSGEASNIDDMLLTLADCLQEALPRGLNKDVVGEQLNAFAES
jgi:hypothetical protein